MQFILKIENKKDNYCIHVFIDLSGQPKVAFSATLHIDGSIGLQMYFTLWCTEMFCPTLEDITTHRQVCSYAVSCKLDLSPSYTHTTYEIVVYVRYQRLGMNYDFLLPAFFSAAVTFVL